MVVWNIDLLKILVPLGVVVGTVIYIIVKTFIEERKKKGKK